MITIKDETGFCLTTITNDDDFNHITAGELLERVGFSMSNKWMFSAYHEDTVAEHYDTLTKSKLTKETTFPGFPPPMMVVEAYKQRLGVVEIYNGDTAKSTWVIIATNDTGKLKKEWFLDFCRSHGLAIVDSAHEHRQEA